MFLLLSMLLLVCCHQVMAQEATYRPIIEEGKVWKVGWIPSGSETGKVAQAIAYFWLEEDTDPDNRAYIDLIPDFTSYAKLMKEYVCNDEYKDKFPEGVQFVRFLLEDVTTKTVFDALKIRLGGRAILYCFDGVDGGVDFESCVDGRDYPCYIRNVNRGSCSDGFKGLISMVTSSNYYYTDIFFNEENGRTPEPYYEFETQWLEGIGSMAGPFPSIVDPMRHPIEWYLMECRVGDDVLYYNPDIIDGVNPPDEETKKRIDFTHTQKPRPKAPRRSEIENYVQFSGAFTQSMLDLELGSMSDTYHVNITDDAGNTVYDRTVCAIDVLALNIDISEWKDATYTITVESDTECYTGTFSPSDPTAVEPVTVHPTQGVTYDLTGRRLDHEPIHGLYIRDGKKILK